MLLKKLTLVGFKSFADASRLELEPGAEGGQGLFESAGPAEDGRSLVVRLETPGVEIEGMVHGIELPFEVALSVERARQPLRRASPPPPCRTNSGTG
mgnify:CR=1 FL=1